MKLVDIIVREQAGIDRYEQPIRFGVPVAAGELPHGALLGGASEKRASSDAS